LASRSPAKRSLGESLSLRLGGSPDAQPLRVWLDGVRLELEQMRYAFGTCVLPAAGVSAPHIRPRVYWGAVARGVEDPLDLGRGGRRDGGPAGDDGEIQAPGHRAPCGLADVNGLQPEQPARAGTTPDGEDGRQAPGELAGCGAPDWNGSAIRALASLSRRRGRSQAASRSSEDSGTPLFPSSPPSSSGPSSRPSRSLDC
jgi:site-specific DNA-cytosine methylase